MTENEIIEALCFDFANDLRERIKYVKLCWKGDLDGDDDGLFWHFSRLSVLRHMLVDQQLWLSDLSHSNDEDEIVYGLRRAACVVREVSSRWECKERAKIVRTLAARTIKTFTNEFHVYAFCLSDERDTVQHWNEYGGGLRTIPSPDDPAVAIGFIGEALFHPLALSPVDSSIFLINAVSGVEAVDHLLQYWTIKARKTLEFVDKRIERTSIIRIYKVLRHMIILICVLGKSDGWRDDHEYRLLYIIKTFGHEHKSLPLKPSRDDRYVPLKWTADQLPIRAVTPHPLADIDVVRRQLQQLRDGNRIELIPSKLRPRPR